MDSSVKWTYKEMGKICSDFRYNIGTPIIDYAEGKASVEVKFGVTNIKEILDASQVIACDCFFGSNFMLDQYQAQNLNKNILSYIEENYNIQYLYGFDENELLDVYIAGTMGYCHENNVFESVKIINKSHTLTFDFQNGNWKLSDCGEFKYLFPHCWEILM